jgi:protein SCO1/2
MFGGRDMQAPMPRVLVLAFTLFLAACNREQSWHATNIAGAMPRLEFRLTRAGDGRSVSASTYRGKVVLLYFGYTHCPDICPTTLANLSDALKRLRERASDVRVLFVTVDPDRDTSRVLSEYVKAFAPEIDGLRGDNDALASLARRYRVAYSVTKESGTYDVMHSEAVFFFDRDGHARLVTTSTENTADIAYDIGHLLDAV